MQEIGKMGYVVIKFDINQLGDTENHTIQESLCGNLYDPQSDLKPCKGFNRSSLRAAMKLKYLPTLYKKMPIAHKGALHRFSFLMEELQTIQINKGVRSYNKLLSAMKRNDFEYCFDYCK